MTHNKHHFQKTKQYQNSSVRGKNVCSSIIQLFEKIFALKADLLKTKFNLMSFSLPHSLPFESMFLGRCIWDTVMADLGMKIGNIIS